MICDDTILTIIFFFLISRQTFTDLNEQQNTFDGYSNADLDVVLVHTISFT